MKSAKLKSPSSHLLKPASLAGKSDCASFTTMDVAPIWRRLYVETTRP
jgi:hypothetical protein